MDYKIPEIFDKNGKKLHIGTVITPFWLWLVREAKIEVIDAVEFIEVHGFAKEGDNMVPVISFAELLELYKSQNGIAIILADHEIEVKKSISGYTNNSLPSDIRDEMDADMEESGMAQGEIESCLSHWSNKYVIQRKEWFSNDN